MFHSARLGMVAVIFAAALHAQKFPVITNVVNAASQDGRIAPLTLVDIIGTDLGTDKSIGAFIATKPARVVTATNTKWRVLVPQTVSPGPATVDIGDLSNTFTITIVPYAPALFSADGTGTGVVSALGYRLNSSGGLMLPGYPLSAASPAKLGDVLILNATGLGPVDPNEGNSVLGALTATVSGRPVSVNFAPQITDTTDPDLCYGTCNLWYYEVMIALPAALPTGNQTVSLTVEGVSSQALSIPINSTPLVNAVVNAASYSGTAPLSPSGLASVFGTTFGVNDVVTSPWPLDAQGVNVTFNGVKAPLVALVASQGQINVQVPVETAPGSATMKVTTPDGVSADFPVTVVTSSPGVFFIPSTLQGRPRNAAALFNNTQWRVVPTDLAEEWGWSTQCRTSGVAATTLCGEPAHPGDYIQVYLTGLGKAAVNGDASQGVLGTGMQAPASGSPLYMPLEQPVVSLGGVVVAPQFVGVAPGFAGLYQINLQIPPNAPTGDYVKLSVTMPNGQKDEGTTIAIKPLP